MRGGARPAYTLWRIFAAPIGLGVVSAIGLTAALVGDGAWDAASWLCLGLPVAVSLWCSGVRRGRA